MWTTAASAAVTLALSQAAPAAACDNAGRMPGDLGAGARNAAVLCLLNEERAVRGLARVKLDRRLSRVARAHSAEMVADRYFAHDSSSGASFADRIARSGWMRGRASWVVGETLAWGTGDHATPGATLAAWMDSPAHRREILRPGYRAVGIGIVLGVPVDGQDGDGATYTADFGGP
jgi:uncharacterized protein YkwD